MRAIRKLNKMRISNARKEITYEAIMTDLVLMGVISKAQAEAVLGFTIGDDILLPKEYYELQG